MAKTKKKKWKLNRLLFALLLLYIFIFLGYNFLDAKIKNIYIYDNQILSDNEIKQLANIDNHPSYFLTTSNSIKRRLKGSPYIKDVKVRKGLFFKLNITVTEYKPVFTKRSDLKIVLGNGKEILTDHDFNNVPTLINYVPTEQYNKLIKKMSLIDTNIVDKISEIEYSPNSIDKNRFLLSMNDGNYIYLTLSKYDKLNLYLKALPEVEGKKGIFYWDSGNYFEIIE
jgi:cell division septal protein FtsQ